MKHGSCSMITKPFFPLQHGDFDAKRLHWESQEECPMIGSFRLSPSYGGTPLHLQGRIHITALAKWHRESPMAGSFTSIHRHEEPLPLQGVFTTYRAHPARARRGKDNCRFFPWGSSHLDLSKKPLETSSRYDSTPDTL